MKKRILIIFTLFVFALTNSSCDSWLDVTPQAQVNAEKLFSKPKGFENALYGIYTSMTDASSYGTHMTFGLMDVLAQYYDVYQDKYHFLYEASRYNYKNSNSQDVIKNLWLKNYNSIANCNVLLDYLSEKSPSFFEGEEYKFLVAETKALRAYLHFDLLRAFAPSWKENSEALCLPYADNFTDRVHGQKKTSEIVRLILTDLDSARTMLSTVDPAREEGFKDMYNHYVTEIGNDFTTARAYRMNYWAITGLMARVYHYMGDERAYTYAQEVIQAGKDGFFPFTEESAVSAPLKSRDVVMQNEILFALNYAGIHDLWYSYDASQDNYYTINDVTSIYPSSDDFRKEYLVITNSNGYDISVKYADVDSENGGKVPMIRLSEMYLIAAEAYAMSGDETNASAMLNKLKTARVKGWSDKSYKGDALIKEIQDEYVRELFGEQPYFFDLKRWKKGLNRSSSEAQDISYLPALGTDMVKSADDHMWVWPIPKDEIDANPQIKGQQNAGY